MTFLNLKSSKIRKKSSKYIPIVNLDVIDSCTSKCKTCHIWKHDNPVAVTFEEYKKLLAELGEFKTQIISIGGGEPLLRNDICNIIKESKRNGFSVHMNSSLVGISKSQIDQLIDAGLDFIHVSIDHFEKDKYHEIRGINALDHVLGNLNYLVSKNIEVGINVVISKLNILDIDRILEWCLKQKVQKVQFILAKNTLQQNDMSDSEFQEYALADNEILVIKEKLLAFQTAAEKIGVLSNSSMFLENLIEVNRERRLIPCYVGRATVTIDPFGFVRTCYAYPSKLSIKNSTLKDILLSKSYERDLANVDMCKKACHDVGSAEISIRMNLRYSILNIKKVILEVVRYTR